MKFQRASERVGKIRRVMQLQAAAGELDGEPNGLSKHFQNISITKNNESPLP